MEVTGAEVPGGWLGDETLVRNVDSSELADRREDLCWPLVLAWRRKERVDGTNDDEGGCVIGDEEKDEAVDEDEDEDEDGDEDEDEDEIPERRGTTEGVEIMSLDACPTLRKGSAELANYF